MKKSEIICFLLLLLGILLATEAGAGTGAIPSGPDIKMLKNSIRFKENNLRLIGNDTDDPTSASKTGDLGSAYIQAGTGDWYKKADNGDTTNWQNFIFGALGLIGQDECVPRWDTGSGVLQDSGFCIDDSNIGTGLAGLYVDGPGHYDTLHIGAPSRSATAGLVFEIEDSTNTTVISVSDSGDIIAGKTGSFIDLSTDTHSDSLHVGPSNISASSTSKLEIEDDTNTVVMTVEDDGDILLGKSGQEVTVQSIDIVDVAERTVLVQDGALGLVATGVSVSATDDVSGVNNLSLTGNVEYTGNFSVASDAVDGSDISSISISGGGGTALTRGAQLVLGGNESGLSGSAEIRLGQVANGDFDIYGFSNSIIFSVDGFTGDIYYPSPAPSLPLALDASNVIVSRAIDVSTGDITGVLPIANGGTNSSTALNNDRIMISSGGSIVEAPALTDGQLLIGSSGSAPVANTLTGTLNQVDIANASGSITLSLPQDIATTSSPTFSTILATDLTAGSVIFAGTSSELADDNANLFYDNGADALGLGTNSIDTNAILHISSSSKGVLLPNLTTAQKNGIVGPTESLLLYDTDIQKFNFWNGSAWKNISGTTLSSETVAIEDYDEVRIPLSQLTVVSSSATNRIARLETGSDNFLENPSFEAETYTSGWTTSGSATYTLNPDGWEGQGVSISATGGTQSFKLFQSFTDTEFEGNTFGFTCMVKSNSAKVKLCTENGTEEKDCVYHDGNGMWKKMQAIMMVDSTGVLVGSVKNDVNENAEVVVDACEWSNDPLKVKNALTVNSVKLEGNDGRGINANTEPMFFSGSGTGWVSGGDGTTLGNGNHYVVQNNNAVIHLKGYINYTTAAQTFFSLYKNGVQYKRINDNLDSVTTHSIDFQSAKGEFQAGDQIAIINNSNGRTLSNVSNTIHWLNIVETLENEEILTASDIVSSETIAWAFEPTATFDCSTQPVGTYTTYAKTIESNVFTNCAAAPTVQPNNLDGFRIRGIGYSETGTCSNPTRFEICVGKGLRGFKTFGYTGTAKSGNKISLDRMFNGSSAGFGAQEFYDEATGVYSINAGTNGNSNEDNRTFYREDGSTSDDPYIHFHASKNPVVNAMETIPIVDYSWENEFSILIDTTSPCTILSQNQDLVESCTYNTTGDVTLNYKTGALTQDPSVVATSVGSFRYVNITTSDTTSTRIQVRRADTLALDNRVVHVQISRQGSDYKERGSTAAIIAQPTCYIKNVQPSATAGDLDSGGGAYDTLTLNTLNGDCSGFSLGSSVITIPEGTYNVDGVAPAYRVNSFKCKLENTSDTTVAIRGSGGFADFQTSSNGQTYSHIKGQLVVPSGGKNFEIQCAGSGGSGSWGTAYNNGEDNIYAQIKFQRIK